mgnify:FL=1
MSSEDTGSGLGTAADSPRRPQPNRSPAAAAADGGAGDAHVPFQVTGVGSNVGSAGAQPAAPEPPRSLDHVRLNDMMLRGLQRRAQRGHAVRRYTPINEYLSEASNGPGLAFPLALADHDYFDHVLAISVAARRFTCFIEDLDKPERRGRRPLVPMEHDELERRLEFEASVNIIVSRGAPDARSDAGCPPGSARRFDVLALNGESAAALRDRDGQETTEDGRRQRFRAVQRQFGYEYMLEVTPAGAGLPARHHPYQELVQALSQFVVLRVLVELNTQETGRGLRRCPTGRLLVYTLKPATDKPAPIRAGSFVVGWVRPALHPAALAQHREETATVRIGRVP